MMPTSHAPRIDVAAPAVENKTKVRYGLTCDAGMREYFSSERMFVTYDVDVSNVPEHLLLIPLLSTLAPISWSLGAELRVPSIDKAFLDALGQIREAFRRLHPASSWGGEISADRIVDHGQAAARGNSAILFSGGVDSVISFVAHRQENPRLVTVWGADLGLSQRRDWEKVSTSNRTFAHSRSVDISFIETNFRTFFNSYKLEAGFPQRFPNWYSGYQQGLGLVGLCAPLSHVHALRRIYIPSTHTASFDRSWGSHPEIDNHIRWASTRTIHDGYELSRQKKLRLLAKYIREEGHRVPLRVCWAHGTNCSRCEKCCITMLGLALEGLDPNDHGFRFSSATLSHIRGRLEKGRFALSDSLVWLFTEIQTDDASRPDKLAVHGLDEFLGWLRGISLQNLQEKSRRSPRKTVRRFLENQPEPIGRSLRRVIGHPFP
jgi:hypothetical protein